MIHPSPYLFSARTLSGLALLVSALPALAAESTSKQLPDLLVTASRSAQPLEASLASYTVITRAQIEQLQATDVIELLRSLPGVDVSSTGGAGKTSSVFMRGTESDHVLVLVDGIKIGSATSGTSPFEHLPIEQIERIEIVRGPRSSLYGSEAIGGVIQIFTRRAQSEHWQPSLLLSAENRGGGRAQLGLSGGDKDFWFAASGGYRHTDGINVQPASGEADADGYDQINGAFKLGAQIGDNQQLQLQAMQSDGENEYDSSFTPGADSNNTRLQVIGGSWQGHWLANWGTRLSAGQSRDIFENLEDEQKSSRFETRRLHLSLINDLALGQHQMLSLGADWLDDKVQSSTNFVRDSRQNNGVFLQYRSEFGQQDVQLSARYDDDESFGSQQTGGAAWAIRLRPELRLSASWASGFRSPSFNELYFPGFGNPDLDPETSQSLELGLSGQHSRWNWAINAYQTDIEDLIATVEVDPDNFIYEPRNVDEARILGVETQLGWQYRNWSLRGSFTWADPENRSDGSNKGKTLRRRSQQSARLDLDHRIAGMDWGLSVLAVGRRYEDTANQLRLPGYATVDLRIAQRLSQAWQLQAAIYNVLDKAYQTAAGFPLPGTSYRLNLRYSPQD